MRTSRNPAAFQPTQVTTVITVVYLVLFTVLLYIHHTVPAAPEAETPLPGINQTQAWADLQELSRDFRPYNSHRNDEIRKWLIDRATALATTNGRTVTSLGLTNNTQAAGDVVIWEDLRSNVTFLDWVGRPWSCYIESQNVMIYLRGTEDEEGVWWEGPFKNKQGILVNAHYDSVSTGYGATDDGCGVITVLQLISHYTTSGNTPRNGIIFLLNNGEEEGLYGAHAFSQHPWSLFPGSFLNLEGAGAGGRATLFRSTDADITSFYASSPHPFGTVLSADGFKRGFVRSGTDYSVFADDLDIRGLDVAFMEPRSRYHTDQDDAKDTGKDSLWHMLSMALSTTQALDQHKGDWEPLSAIRADGVWFDMFGEAFAVLTLDTFSALSITLLIVGPLLIGILVAYLIRTNRWYPFLPRAATNGKISRLRGLFRGPIALLVAGVALFALDYLIESQNPYIVYRSPYFVWMTFTSLFFVVTWAVLKLADHTRPTVFSRWYAALWFYLLSWIALVIAAASAMIAGLGSGYLALVYHLSAFAVLLVGTLEFLVLPQRQDEDRVDEGEESTAPAVDDERTALLRGSTGQQTFTGNVSDPIDAEDTPSTRILLKHGSPDLGLDLPSWTWLLQFLILAPINIILIGQISLFVTSALSQTIADGSDNSIIYQSFLACSILLLSPVLPFVHKVRPSIPFLLLVVFIGSTLWTTLAFPFDRDARLKYFFLQQVDLKTGINNVSLTAISPYLEHIISEMPSAAGQEPVCRPSGEAFRSGLSTCAWHGLEPEVVPGKPHDYSSWLQYNVTALNATSAVFSVQGTQTKNCRITFDTPVQALSVLDGADDPKRATISEHGNTQVRLFSREWDKRFEVRVSWAESEKLAHQTGRIGCMWAELDRVPAIKELQLFAPVWSALTKQDDGLVEGWYDWKISSSAL